MEPGDIVKLLDGVRGCDQTGEVVKVLGLGRIIVRWHPDDSLEEVNEDDIIVVD